ncbi:unnamed protein product [Clonostachys byssicola]|uniref:Uncharacterized protein n=1 Tax=Clonostachys byssicola TaxID=160290 RepID=A0A9N9U7N3_9HYPO|nr:unnamed protein product [Clonostachys byssicola]
MSANERPKGLSFRPKNIRTPQDTRDQRAVDAQEREEEDYWWEHHGIPPADQDRTRHNLNTRHRPSPTPTEQALKRQRDQRRHQQRHQRRNQQQNQQQGQQLELPSFCQQPSQQQNQQPSQQRDQLQSQQRDQQQDQPQRQQFKLPPFCRQPQPNGALNPPYFEYRCPGKRELNDQVVYQPFCHAQHLTVPFFKDTIISLLGRLANDEFEELRSMNIMRTISEWGSLDEIADIATAQILPQFLELQGKSLTAEMIHKEQFKDPTVWTETDIGGYIMIGLDDRDKYYIRYYVGQSFQLSTRVCIQHAESIWDSDTRRLCYYILAKGEGHRSAYFVRL